MSKLLKERWLRLAFADDSTTVLTEKKKDDPCWDNYEMVGTKEKDGKEVPNCVPESDEINEADETDENAFMTKIAHAAVDGEEKVIIGDKEYDVDMDKETAEDITGEKAADEAISEAVHNWKQMISESGFDKEKKDKMKANSPRYLKKGEPGHGKKQKVVKATHKGEEKIIKFGDANMKNKSNVKSNRENFRKRHKCADKSKEKDWDTASYWACKDW